jgi:uncharacterized protein (DUF2147 family)
MNINPKVFLLSIFMIPLLDSNFSPTPLNAQIEVPKAEASTLIIAQVSPLLIENTWQPDNNKFRVRFSKENNIYNGKIVWLPPGAQTKDIKNPDPKLRSRNLIGSQIFTGFTYNPDKKQWTGGTVYIAELGRTMKPKLWMESADTLKMQISMGPMRKTLTLKALK